eukprot:gene19076-22842_t
MRSRAGIEYGPKPITPLNKISWDPVIEAKMQQFIEQKCEYQTIPSSSYSPYGYSSWLVSATNFKGYDTFMRSYNSSAPYYNFETAGCNDDKCCLMYATMMWNASTAMGCGYKVCDGRSGVRGWLLCGYNPAGSSCGVNPYTPMPINGLPTSKPTLRPTIAPTNTPTNRPTSLPTSPPTNRPTSPPQPTSTTMITPAISGNDIDWRNAGIVTKIKDQKQCGSCWAFTSVAALESAYLLKNNLTIDIDLSEQHVVNCASSNGCNGGNGAMAYSSLKSTGIVYESALPYTAVSQQCKTPSSATIKFSGYNSITPSKENYLQELRNGPFYIAVYADQGFMNYRQGRYSCSQSSSPNHAVLLVGYSSSDDSWIIKNSWGTWWGNAGYIKLSASSCNIFASKGYRPVI